MILPGRLSPGEMYPAGEANVSARFVRLPSGITVRAVESGSSDAPAIVLVPGWACTAWIYHQTLPALASAGFRAIAVELKGHGLSDKPTGPGEYSLASMTDHLLTILDALALPMAGLVGHSMGASIAAHAAQRSPDRVSGLALVAPVGFAGVRGMGLFRALTPAMLVPLLAGLPTRFVVRTMLRFVYGDLRGPDTRDVDELRAPSQFPEYTRALRNLLHEFDWEAEFPRLAMPHMVIAGTRDHLSPARDAHRYARGESLVIVEGAGHVLFSEAPEVINETLVRFFRSPHGGDYISSQ
jgi:pimeloyl-ACP methyl ester carboxylesterase